MLEDLRKFYTPTSNYIYNQLSKWNLMLKNIYLKMQEVTKRYENTTILAPTNGARLLDRILRTADCKWMSERYDNFYIYNTQIPSLIDHYKTVVLHPSIEGKMYKNLFSFSSIKDINEYIILPEDNDWLKFLPIEKRDYKDWNYVQPLTLWWNDSPEQTFDIISMGNLRFHHYPPALSMWILDIPALVLKAVQYFRSFPNGNLDVYIKDVFKDIPKMSMDMWIFKLQRDAVKIVLENKTLESVLSLYKTRMSTYSYIGPNLEEALKELIVLFNEVKKGAIKPLYIFSILINFLKLILDLDVKYNLSHFHQYKAMLLIRDIPYIDYVLDVYSLHPELPITKELRIKMKLLISKWKNDIPLSYIKSQHHREYIQKYLNKWQDFCLKQ